MKQEYIALRNHIDALLKKKFRYDGRKLEEYRDMVIETDVISQAEGSARVTIGETEIIIGVKVGIGTPFPDSEDEGILMVSAEHTPIADPEYEPGPPSEDAIELSRVVDRAVRESKVIDMKKLCIKKGEKVWTVFIDAIILNNDGNLFDACEMGAMAALKSTVFPEYDKKTEKVNIYVKSKNKLPLEEKKIPIMMTFVKIGDEVLIDPKLEEENVADAFLHIAIANNNICAMQKGGRGYFTEKEMLDLVEKAIKIGKERKKLIK